MAKRIDTVGWSKHWREAGLDVEGRRVLITNYNGTEQEADLQEPPNCLGFGRIRHFGRTTSAGWPLNPLPIDPASKALGLKPRRSPSSSGISECGMQLALLVLLCPFQSPFG